MRAVTPAEPHNPELCGSSHAIRRQDWRRGTQDCVLHLKGPPARWSKPPSLPCRQSCRQSDTIPSCAGVPTPSAAMTGGVARKTACSTSRGRPQGGASRQACHAGSHAGRATQSRAVRGFQRHPPPRLAAWHARLRAPLEGVARKTARSTSRRRPLWSKPPGLPGRRARGQSHTIPSCAGVPTPSAAKTGGVARKTACST